jgi:short-subunit dehydrogenase
VAAMAHQGARVACSGRSAAALERVGQRTDSWTFPVDLACAGGPQRLVAAAADELGGLDVVVSCAGAGWAGPIAEMMPGDIDALVDVNLRAPLQLAAACVPHLRAAGGGRLLLVSSIAGVVGVPGEAAYSAVKAGLSGLADALREELAGDHISVTLAVLGVVDTAFFERRNRPYERRWPRPLPVEGVADKVLAALVRGRPDVYVPRWLVAPVFVHGAVPRLYRTLSRRFG